MTKKIGIIDADLIDNGTKHPNLALMKISTYQKEQNNSVELLNNYEEINTFDEVFISKVFSFTKSPKGIEKLRNATKRG